MSQEKRGYYDIDCDVMLDEIPDARINEVLYVKDLKQRKLYLNDDINSDSAMEIVHHILQFNTDDAGIPADSRRPILLYVTSCGGSVDAGFALIDAIRCSKTPVYTINIGFQYSMGFLIGLAGHKRFAMPNARFLLHDGSDFVFDSGAKAQDQMEFHKKANARTKEYILAMSKVTPEEYDSRLRVEWYMFAEEAKRYGFTDCIVGQDCDIDAII